MAKSIKAIKCPQCGSTRVTEIRTDYFVCKNCNTEFFLDNDDITINHYHHNIEGAVPAVKLSPKKILLAAAVFFGFMILILVIPALNSSDDGMPALTSKWTIGEPYYFQNKENLPMYVLIGHFKSADKKFDKSQLNIGFFNVKNRKRVKMATLPIPTENVNVEYRTFSDGQVFFILNNKHLFYIDKDSLNAVEYPSKNYTSLPGLSSGFSSIKFYYKKEDCFEVISNDGSERMYYPLTGQSIPSKELYNYKQDISNIPPNAPMQTQFAFVESSNDVVGSKKSALIKYKQSIVLGAPLQQIAFDWQDESDSSTAPNNRKDLFVPKSFVTAKADSIHEFTKGMRYYDPKLLAYNDQVVLISFKAKAEVFEKYTLQLLDAKSGKVLWSHLLSEEKNMYSPREALITNVGYLVDFGPQIGYWDLKGGFVNLFNYMDAD